MPDTEQSSSRVMTITIQGKKFDLEPPYKEGDVLSAVEAGVLNQTFAENIRNNFAQQLKAMRAEYAKTNDMFVEEDGKKVPDVESVSINDLDEDDIRDAYAKYVEDYEFGTRRAGGGGARIIDPVERETNRLAKEKVKELLRANGYQVNKIPKEKMDELVTQAIAKFPEISETAKRLVEASKNIDLASLKI